MSTGDYADWAGGLIYLKPDATAKPESWTFPSEPAPPIASGWPAAPRINPPRITGGTPGRPFLFRIPATGEAPLTFAARNLPNGLMLDAKTGIISGAIAREGRTDVEITVTNARGRSTRALTIVGGKDALALTPPLGWNSWNVWGAFGGRCEGSSSGRRDGVERPGSARLSVRQHRRRLGRRSATARACCSRTRSFRT